MIPTTSKPPSSADNVEELVSPVCCKTLQLHCHTKQNKTNRPAPDSFEPPPQAPSSQQHAAEVFFQNEQLSEYTAVEQQRTDAIQRRSFTKTCTHRIKEGCTYTCMHIGKSTCTSISISIHLQHAYFSLLPDEKESRHHW